MKFIRFVVFMFLLISPYQMYATLGIVEKKKAIVDVVMPNSLERNNGFMRTLSAAAQDGNIIEKTFNASYDAACEWKIDKPSFEITGKQLKNVQGDFGPNVFGAVKLFSAPNGGTVPNPSGYNFSVTGKYKILPNPKGKSSSSRPTNISVTPSSESSGIPNTEARYNLSENISKQSTGELLFTVDCSTESVVLSVPKSEETPSATATLKKQLEKSTKGLTSECHSFTIRPNTLADMDNISGYADIWEHEMKSAYVSKVDRQINTAR